MALLQPMLFCLVDREPTLFNANDEDGTTLSFAANLSFDARSDGDILRGTVADEEDATKAQFAAFLRACRAVRFHLFELHVEDGARKLVSRGWLDAVSEGEHGDSADLIAWLGKQHVRPGRYWSRIEGKVSEDVAFATATHRLRAAQAWNAPVAHRFGLTHIVRPATGDIQSGLRLILPYFDRFDEKPPAPTYLLPLLSDSLRADTEVDVRYDPYGRIGEVTCRTTPLGEGITPHTFHPKDVDRGIRDDGFLLVDGDAENVRRLVDWVEERASSLLAVNTALAPPDPADSRQPRFDFAAAFGICVEDKTAAPAAWRFFWGGAPWYAVARLTTALDNFVVALMKPITGPSRAASAEGEVLAPLVSALRREIMSEVGNLALDPARLEPSHIVVAIRTVLARSPLMAPTDPGRALLVRALRRVYGLADAPAYLDEHTLVAMLLKAYAENAIGVIGEQAYRPFLSAIHETSANVLSLALHQLEQALSDEAGAEAAIIRLFETVETTIDGQPPAPDARLVPLLSAAILATGPAGPDVRSAVQRGVERAWSGYRATLEGPFNGAEAVRRAAASSYLLGLLTRAEEHPAGAATRSDNIGKTLSDSAFYVQRIFGVFADVMKPLEQLRTPDLGALDSTTQAALRLYLQRQFDDAVAPLAQLKDLRRRFIPDSAPQPLPIQIAANIDRSTVDQFARAFNGIAVAIQRLDERGDDRWAYAHLADLAWDSAAGAERTIQAALHPWLPAISDGRGAMFVDYAGFPFADAATDERVIEGAAEALSPGSAPFYRAAPHQPGDGYAAVPRLAYGRRFETFSFVTSNAGTLPRSLQRSPDEPWMPMDRPSAPEMPSEVVDQMDCQRRTAIAQMAIDEKVREARPHRIGAPIPGVRPLASDYPRRALQAWPDAPAACDVFRRADGSGTMRAGQVVEGQLLPSGGSWTLSNLAFGGTPRQLTIRFFTRLAASPLDEDEVVVGTEKPIKINATSVPDFTSLREISVQIAYTDAARNPCLVIDCGGHTIERELDIRGPFDGWLRLSLEVNAAPATLSFTDPAPQRSGAIGAPLLLLAPNSKTWKAEASHEVETSVTTPRVTYLDFERWFANADLADDMFDAISTDAVAQFEQALLAAYVMRHLDKRLATLIDRLPDPAVEAVRVELAEHDTLRDAVAVGLGYKTVPLKPLLGGFVKTFPGVVARMRAALPPSEQNVGGPAPWTPLRLRKHLLEPLDELFRFTIRMVEGNTLELAGTPTDIAATVPSGVIARVSLDALVPTRHLKPKGRHHPSVIDPRLAQYSPRELPGEMLAFPSAAIQIEAMADIDDLFVSPPTRPAPDRQYNHLAIDLAERMIAPEVVERVRRFDLMTAAALAPRGGETEAQREQLTRRWRAIGEIDAITQRWRPSGRPIYHHVDPRSHQATAATDLHPAVPLSLDAHRPDDGLALSLFEQEAFFDRPDADAQTVTQPLDPLPSRTRLQEQPWNAESATYSRHRFILRTRYAGALAAAERREVVAWPTRALEKPLRSGSNHDLRTPAHGWTVRVAMLADLSRILLTRPQLRALIPLTTAPGGEGVARSAPPVAAVLQEPPFARGGLAERLASEIKTGFGYGFATEASTEVEILSSRKEAGPNPQLDYDPIPATDALGLVLHGEGPLGLTFDAVNAPTPAYPNSIVLLRPALLDKGLPLEEMFAAVALQRYIDPNWTTAPRKQAETLDAERCWWIDVEEAVEGKAILAYRTAIPGVAPAGLDELLRVVADGAGWFTIEASKRAIDGVRGHGTDWVPIARLADGHLSTLAMLHQSVAPGRYATAVLVRNAAPRTERGEIDAPTVLTTIEWSPPRASGEAPAFLELVLPVASYATATMASAPTLKRWTRTGRDFDLLHMREETGDGLSNDSVTPARDLVAELGPHHEWITFKRRGTEAPIWLRPSIADKPFPLEVHRHIGLITSRFLKEFGSPAEVFCRTSADPERTPSLVTLAGDLRNDGGIYKPQEQSVRVVEFETRAAILSAAAAVIPAYRQAYFDLVSTGFPLSRSPQAGKTTSGSLRFYLRLVGTDTDVAAFTGITLKIRAAGQNGSTELPVSWSNPSAHVVGLQLVVRLDSPRDPAFVVRLLRSNGTRDTPVVAPRENKFVLTDVGETSPGVFLAVANPRGGSPGAEFWCDASLLHSSDLIPNEPLDLRWLFSATSEDDPAMQVTRPGLTAMVEAQARIVAVSPPIPIVKH